jgi:nucleoside-diphosphate-sugar epimerase
MKILITGATGFIGNHLTRRLLEENHEVYCIVRPSTQQLFDKKVTVFIHGDNNEEFLTFMHKERFDGVIHLASLYLASHEPHQIKDLIESNVTFGTTILEASVRTSVKWFINTGTFWQHYNNKTYSPVNLYAASKQAFESISQYYLETSPITLVTIKLADTFGPHDTRSKIVNLLTKIHRSGETLDMSPGKQILDINYIDNIIDGYIHMIGLVSQKDGSKMRGKSYALYAPKRYSLQSLVKVFEKITGTKLLINWGKREYRNREVMIPWNKGRPIPGFKPKHSLENGIRKIVDLK